MNTSTFIISILIILYLPTPSLSHSCNKHDEKTLLKIKKSFGNPNALVSWQNTSYCCEWEYVECDPITGRVNGLRICHSDISSQIPHEVGDLTCLRELHLCSLKNLYGQIPSSLNKLANLNILDLSFNNLSGSIPELSFKNQNDLSVFLSYNKLTGTVPKSFRRLNLSSINLSSNQLTGDLSMLLGPNKAIEYAHFSGNNFQFNLSKVVEYSTRLVHLDLSHNKIYGSLSATLPRNVRLQYLDVSYNRLCGKIPQGGVMQKFDTTAYFHNQCLCGPPLPACS